MNKALNLTNPFDIILRDEEDNERTLSGTLREYTKAESKAQKLKYKPLLDMAEKAKTLRQKLDRVERRIEIKERLEDYDAVDKLEDKKDKLEDDLNKLDDAVDKDSGDEGIKDRFMTCIGGRDKEEILELAEKVGYQLVYMKAIESISAGK